MNPAIIIPSTRNTHLELNMNRPFANTAAADYEATVAAVELQLAKLKGKIEAHKAKAAALDEESTLYVTVQSGVLSVTVSLDALYDPE